MKLKGFFDSQWIFVSLMMFMAYSTSRDVSFSVPEEMKHGSVLGNIAKDLGLDVNMLSARKARIDAAAVNNKRYCDINQRT